MKCNSIHWHAGRLFILFIYLLLCWLFRLSGSSSSVRISDVTWHSVSNTGKWLRSPSAFSCCNLWKGMFLFSPEECGVGHNCSAVFKQQMLCMLIILFMWIQWCHQVGLFFLKFRLRKDLIMFKLFSSTSPILTSSWNFKDIPDSGMSLSCLYEQNAWAASLKPWKMLAHEH